ncbi:hypothetical protein J1614_005426 [Plenodomus biglobosus]|nr:hypothetical protein J1614_005426 [Plenodomus biglobosus]
MPLCTLHLLSLHPTTNLPTFLSTLKSSNITPLVVSRVIRWIILPTKLSTEHLLARNIHWDLLLILPTTSAPLPHPLPQQIAHSWSITAGVPSRLIHNFPAKNNALLHPDPASIPALRRSNNDDGEEEATPTTQSAQHLELSSDLDAWIQHAVSTGAREFQGPVSMFNLLSFNPGMKAEYLKYGAAFADSVGAAHGGDAKIVGTVVDVRGDGDGDGDGVAGASAGANPNPNPSTSKPESAVSAKQDNVERQWDEVALAHYPSLLHFRDMLTSKEYQRVNQRHRVPSLWDTAIFMTSEVGVEDAMRGMGVGAAKL